MSKTHSLQQRHTADTEKGGGGLIMSKKNPDKSPSVSMALRCAAYGLKELSTFLEKLDIHKDWNSPDMVDCLELLAGKQH